MAIFDIEESLRKLREKIAEQDMARGRPLTATEKLANLKAALTRCDKCDNAIEMNWPYCAWCGYQLMELDESQ